MGGGSSSQRYTHAGNDISVKDFSLFQSIGHGEFGNVYLGVHESTREVLAVKQINLARIWERGMKTTMIHNELNALRMIGRHSFITELSFSLLDQGLCYVALNLLSGGCLRDHMASRRFCENSAAFIVACIDSALIHIHSRGILHRDIKPANIVMDAHGFPCLVDFGICYIKKPGEKGPLVCRMTSGTEAYCAPELLTSSHEHGIEAEYWSLGVLAYELIFGHRPFRRKVHKVYAKYIDLRRERERGVRRDASGKYIGTMDAVGSMSRSSKSFNNIGAGHSVSARTMSVCHKDKSFTSRGAVEWYLQAGQLGEDGQLEKEPEAAAKLDVEPKELGEVSDQDKNTTYVEYFENADGQLEEEDEDMERLRKQCTIEMPETTGLDMPVSSSLESFLRGLLEVRLDMRLGGKVSPLLNHEWLKERDLSLESLHRRTLTPPPAVEQAVFAHKESMPMSPDMAHKHQLRPEVGGCLGFTKISCLQSTQTLSPRTSKIHSEIGEYNYVAPKYRRRQKQKAGRWLTS